MNYTYILRCHDGSLYTGWTNNLARRILYHSTGKGAKYTKSRLPVTLVFFEGFPTKEEAMSREWHIKRMTRAEKEALINSFDKGLLSPFTKDEGSMSIV